MTATKSDNTRPPSRLALYLIIGTTLAVVAASTALFTATQKGWVDLPALLGTNNNGVLLSPPRAIAELPMRDEAGAEFLYADQKLQWTLLVPAASSCDEACEQSLYLTRQVRAALGRETQRVRRYLLATGGPLSPAFWQLLQEQHGDLQILSTPAAVFARFAGDPVDPLQPPRFYIVDPYGWMMMYYTARHDGHAVLDDLKFLVKNAHENEVVE